MKRNVIIVGGGLAGLAASIYLARGGRTVTVFEKRRNLGGRAVTHLRQGFRFNLGAHAVFRFGPGAAVYRELGVPVRGGKAKSEGVALLDGDTHKFPGSVWTFLTSSLLSIKAKAEAMALLVRIWRLDPSTLASMTVREWLDANVNDARLRQVMEALLRLATYADHADTQSAAVALRQLKMVLRGALYVDEGWQKLVDSLHSHAVSAGVNFVTSSRIVGVHHENGAVRAVELGGLELDADRMDTQSIALPDLVDAVDGARLPADTVILAVDPATASELVDDETITRAWTASQPVTAACLDVALSRLPNPKQTFALGIDQPLYLSVHSRYAQLTPKGGALVHLAKYRNGKDGGDAEGELESLLDRVQPGWREALVHRRFLPSMTVSNALVTPHAQRPAAATPIRGLYIAGDWVGSEGLLSDAALSSARAAAKAILAS